MNLKSFPGTSCRAMVKNGNGISDDGTEDPIKNY